MRPRNFIYRNISHLLIFFTVIIFVLTLDLGKILLSKEVLQKQGNLQITSYYLRGTMQERPAAAYMTILNTGGTTDKLIGASSTMVKKIEFHEMRIDNGVAKMRRLHQIVISPNSSVDLKPGGLHLMLMGLKKSIVAGDKFDIILNFEKAGDVKLEVPVNTFSDKKRADESHKGQTHKKYLEHTKH